MPTPTHQLRANRSADARLVEYDKRLRAAQDRDRRNEEPHDKQQWNVVLGWILAESKNVDPGSRRQMFDHLMQCARDMNTASRRQ